MKLLDLKKFEGYGDGFVLSVCKFKRITLLEIEAEKSVMPSYTVMMQLGITSLFYLAISFIRYGVSLSLVTKTYNY